MKAAAPPDGAIQLAVKPEAPIEVAAAIVGAFGKVVNVASGE